MKFLKNITNRVASYLNGAGSIYESTPLTFPELDIEKIKKKLSLLDEAKQRGAKNIPLSSSKIPDDVEKSIQNFIASQIRESTETYSEYNRAFEMRLNSLNASGHAERLEEVASAAEDDFKRDIKQNSIEIHIAKKRVIEFEKHVDKFKQDNQLDRPAILPDNRFLQIALLFLILVVETGLNGKFFATNDEFGLIGGVITAVIPSLMNMLFAFFLGHYAFRLVVSVKKITRYFGIILVSVLPIIILLINIGVAHYRAAYILGEDEAAKVALSTMKSSIFSLGDIKSWLLFMLGCACSLIATIDFWKMDDKYPGYGDITRKRDNKINEYEDMISFEFEKLQEIRDDRLQELEVIFSQSSSKESEALAVINNQRMWSVKFKDYLDHLQSIGSTLISFYRNKNVEFRTDTPPTYFDKEWKLEYEDLDLNKTKYTIDDFKSDPVKIQKQYSLSIEKINKAYSSTLQKFETIDELRVVSTTNEAELEVVTNG